MAGGSTYLPLPQSNTESNSDSEEELHSCQENNVTNRPKPRPEFRTDPFQLNYNQLDDDHDLTLKGLATVTAVKPVTLRPGLSKTRKVLFVFSLLLCVATIVGFLWVLPCDLDICTPVATLGGKSWETPLPNLELYGPIAIVDRPVGPGKNLVFMGRNGVMAKPAPKRHRVICLLGGSGELAWTHLLAREPIDMDCSDLDTNKDGVKDCIVAGNQDLLKAINPLSGLVLWELSPITNGAKPVRTQFPVRIPDVDKDNVPDLIAARSFFDRRSVSHLLVVSGATGKILGNIVATPSCAGIGGLILEKDFSLSYSCIDFDNKVSEKTIGLGQLLESATVHIPVPWPFEEAQDLPRMYDAGTKTNHEVRVLGKRLILKNTGRCPSVCDVEVFAKNDIDNKTIYTFNRSGVYGMAPVPISFGKLSGFAIKYWQWHLRKGKRTSNGTTDDFTFPTAVPTSSQNFSQGLRRARRRTVSEIDIWEEVSERVALLTFNGTEVHEVNVSQQSIVQLCRTPKVCQPNAQTSQHSLLIADLDGDGCRELVSFTSSYVNTAADERLPPQWRLRSKVRVVRLEQELPQLYEALSHV